MNGEALGQQFARKRANSSNRARLFRNTARLEGDRSQIRRGFGNSLAADVPCHPVFVAAGEIAFDST
jgi:hypothetical protein